MRPEADQRATWHACGSLMLHGAKVPGSEVNLRNAPPVCGRPSRMRRPAGARTPPRPCWVLLCLILLIIDVIFEVCGPQTPGELQLSEPHIPQSKAPPLIALTRTCVSVVSGAKFAHTILEAAEVPTKHN